MKNPILATNSMIQRETYGFVSTEKILDTLESKGWKPVSASIAGTRCPNRDGYQKHLLRFENPDFPEIPGLAESNKSRPQLCLVNSHDGTAALRLYFGLIRFACLNGIIAGSCLRDFKACHSKNVISRLGEGVEYMTENIGELISTVQFLQSRELSDSQLAELILKSVDYRLKNVRNIVSVEYTDAVSVLRHQDNATDAFTLFNRIQEKIIRGGIRYQYLRNIKDDSGNIVDWRLVNTKTRRLASVSSQVSLNRLLFDEIMRIVA